MTPSPTPQCLTPARLREIARIVESMDYTGCGTQADELRAHAAYLETQEWQSMATAPKDGPILIAFPCDIPGGWARAIVWWEPNFEQLWSNVEDRLISIGSWSDGTNFTSSLYKPTHWRPLPPAPKPPEAR